MFAQNIITQALRAPGVLADKATATATHAASILLEDGSYLLLESGDTILLE